eukprot:6430540-Pyramimonas_sp.AAC.1
MELASSSRGAGTRAHPSTGGSPRTNLRRCWSAPGALRRLVTALVLGRGSSVINRWARGYLRKLGLAQPTFQPL